jgi:hypothetical protein
VRFGVVAMTNGITPARSATINPDVLPTGGQLTESNPLEPSFGLDLNTIQP